jgi:RimJ/RimL family protein N-acetyltransferase
VPTLDFPVRTDRLHLRPFTVDDLDDAVRYMSDPSVVRFLYWPVRDRDEVRAFLAERAAQGVLERAGDRLCLALELPLTGQVIGEVMLSWVSQEHGQGEFGFVVAPDFQGKGYAGEAALAALSLGFERFGLHRIIGRCDARNTASATLMERLGMRREAHFVQEELFKGEWSSTLVYAMLAEEWASRERPGLGR